MPLLQNSISVRGRVDFIPVLLAKSEMIISYLKISLQ